MTKYFFVFDVESVGLHGEAFAVAGGVYGPSGACQYEFSFSCPIDEAKGDDKGRQWVKENTPPLQITHNAPVSIRNAFWVEWEKAKNKYADIRMAADCGWPVEARFLAACVDDDPSRCFKGPYPFHEIASFLMMAGIWELDSHKREPSENPRHDPLCDSRQSARLLYSAIGKITLASKFIVSSN